MIILAILGIFLCGAVAGIAAFGLFVGYLLDGSE